MVLLNALLMSLVPAGAVLTGGVHAPVVYGLIMRSGAAAGYVLLLGFLYPGLMFSLRAWRTVLGYMGLWKICFVGMLFLDLFLFVLSGQFIDLAVSSVVIQSSPIVLVLSMSFAHRGTGAYRRVGPGLILMGLLAMGGLVLVSGSQQGEFLPALDAGGWELLAGLGFALSAALAGGLNGFVFPWGAELTGRLRSACFSSPGIFGLLSIVTVGNFAVLPLGLAAVLFSGVSMPPLSLGAGLLLGFLVYPVLGYSWRTANLVTRDLGVNLLSCLALPLNVTWLLLLGHVHVARLDWLLLGGGLVLSANALVILDSRRLAGRLA